jgi:hypothetical protein
MATVNWLAFLAGSVTTPHGGAARVLLLVLK